MGRRGRSAERRENRRSLNGKGLGSPQESIAVERIAFLAGNKETKALGKGDVIASGRRRLYGAGDLWVALPHAQGARDGTGPVTPTIGISTADV